MHGRIKKSVVCIGRSTAGITFAAALPSCRMLWRRNSKPPGRSAWKPPCWTFCEMFARPRIFLYPRLPALIATELHYYRGLLPLKRQMFHIFHLLVDAASMDNFTPETQLMIHELCADTRRIAGEMKKVPPRGFYWRELDAKFYSSCPDSANNFWEGKKPSLRQGKSAEAFLRKECMTLPFQQPVWKDLFPNAPEHATAWMENLFDGQCGAPDIQLPWDFSTQPPRIWDAHSRLDDFSRMDHPPAMTPHDLWWNGEEMRVRRSLKLEPCQEQELKIISICFPCFQVARIITEPSLACCSVRTWAAKT